MSFVLAFAGSALAAWLLCEGLSRAAPDRRDGGGPFARRTGRMLGRIAITLGVVAAGLWGVKANPLGVGLGALLGWLVAAGRETLQQQRASARGGKGRF